MKIHNLYFLSATVKFSILQLSCNSGWTLYWSWFRTIRPQCGAYQSWSLNQNL